MQDYANKLLNYENISEEQLCNIFGLDKDKDKDQFSTNNKAYLYFVLFSKKGIDFE